MTLFYRTYDCQWNRTGWSRTPQYLGQLATSYDFPLACPACGKGFVRVGLHHLVNGYLANCSAGHETVAVPITRLIERETAQ